MNRTAEIMKFGHLPFTAEDLACNRRGLLSAAQLAQVAQYYAEARTLQRWYRIGLLALCVVAFAICLGIVAYEGRLERHGPIVVGALGVGVAIILGVSRRTMRKLEADAARPRLCALRGLLTKKSDDGEDFEVEIAGARIWVARELYGKLAEGRSYEIYFVDVIGGIMVAWAEL